jgi:hypothetical protein
LRRLVAQRKLDDEAVGLYFVEQEEGASTIREVPLQPEGAIDAKAWPRGFFEDSLRESMALAQAQASGRKRRLREERARLRQLSLDDATKQADK